MEACSLLGCDVWIAAALPYQLKQNRDGRRGKSFLPRSDPMEVQKFCLDDVRGPVHTIQKVAILPFSTVSVCANTSVKGHCMWVHVLTELMLGPQLPTAVVPTVTYGELHSGSSRVPICLHNLSTHVMEIPTEAVVGQSSLPTKCCL